MVWAPSGSRPQRRTWAGKCHKQAGSTRTLSGSVPPRSGAPGARRRRRRRRAQLVLGSRSPTGARLPAPAARPGHDPPAGEPQLPARRARAPSEPHIRCRLRGQGYLTTVGAAGGSAASPLSQGSGEQNDKASLRPHVPSKQRLLPALHAQGHLVF